MCFKHNFIESETTGAIFCTNCGIHQCKYELIDKWAVLNRFTEVQTGVKYISQCIVCGDIVEEKF